MAWPKKRVREEGDEVFTVVTGSQARPAISCEGGVLEAHGLDWAEVEERWEDAIKAVQEALSPVEGRQYEKLVKLLAGREHFGPLVAEEGYDERVLLQLVSTGMTYIFWLASRLKCCESYSYGLLFEQEQDAPLVTIRFGSQDGLPVYTPSGVEHASLAVALELLDYEGVHNLRW